VLLTDPPFLCLIAFLARLVGGAQRRTYWWTMDLYPEALVADGMVRPGSAIYRALRWLNELALRSVSGVICLGRRQQSRLKEYRNWRRERGFSVIVPPWDFRSVAKVDRAANRFLAQHPWQGKRLVLYAGNLGEAHSFEELLEASRHLAREGNSEWMTVFVVRGARCADLQRATAGLPNVAVLDYQPPELTADLLWAADVHAITMREGWQGIVVPSKLYAALQTEAPVLFIGPDDADTADEVRKYTAGATLPCGCSGKEIAHVLQELCNGKAPHPGPVRRNGPRIIAQFVAGGLTGERPPAPREANGYRQSFLWAMPTHEMQRV
jgi:hypothetical protein